MTRQMLDEHHRDVYDPASRFPFDNIRLHHREWQPELETFQLPGPLPHIQVAGASASSSCASLTTASMELLPQAASDLEVAAGGRGASDISGCVSRRLRAASASAGPTSTGGTGAGDRPAGPELA